MATIFYSVTGEGRGHAARARAMTERLQDQHRVVLFTSYDALAFLQKTCADARGVDVRQIEGLRFYYRGNKMALGRTIGHGLRLWWKAGEVVERLMSQFERDRPDLLISDFEPTLPRAARRCGVPVLSLDHQHFLVAYDLGSLPLALRTYASAMRPFVRAFGIGQQRTVVSAFYRPPLKRGYEEVIQVGPLLRRAVRSQQPVRGEHLLAYLRPQTPPRILAMLRELHLPIRVYGLGSRPAEGDVQFRAIDERQFIEDLATCDAVIAAAGNQLLGEALYFRKPVFALPEQRHYEQCINAWFLQDLGGGSWTPLERVSREDLNSFLERREQYRAKLQAMPDRFDGTDDAAAAIESMLR